MNLTHPKALDIGRDIACKQAKNIALSPPSLALLMIVIHQDLRHGIACI